jgi:hypothetical protein
MAMIERSSPLLECGLRAKAICARSVLPPFENEVFPAHAGKIQSFQEPG